MKPKTKTKKGAKPGVPKASAAYSKRGKPSADTDFTTVDLSMIPAEKAPPPRGGAATPARKSAASASRKAKAGEKALEKARLALEARFLPRTAAARDTVMTKKGLLTKGNILSVSTGSKSVKGKVQPVPCVVVHVAMKRGEDRIAAAARIPKEIDGVPTDVVATGRIRAHGRPALGGESMAHFSVKNGTFTCLVTRPSATAPPPMLDLFVLGCNHTFAACNFGHRQDATHREFVLQPAWGQGGVNPTHAIGILTDYIDLKFDGSYNEVDCAIAKTNASLVSTSLVTGTFDPRPEVATKEMKVITFGAAVGRVAQSEGVVENPTHEGFIDYDFPVVRSAKFYPLIKIRSTSGGPFSKRGDSGALVLEKTSRRPVGMIIGGDDNFSYACHYVTILARLGLQPRF